MLEILNFDHFCRMIGGKDEKGITALATLVYKRCHLTELLQDTRCEDGGAEAIVDVNDADARRTRVEHR